MDRIELKPDVVALTYRCERPDADSEEAMLAIALRRDERIERSRRDRAARWKTRAPMTERRTFKRRVRRSR